MSVTVDDRRQAVEKADLVTLTIDGVEVTAPKGTLVIRAAEQIGIEIPRFCDHPLLAPVGACRQCLVEVEGAAQAGRLLHPDRRRRHGGPHPAHLAGRREGAAGRHGAAADQPPARLPDLRQGRRVPAAEPGDVQRPRRVPVPRAQARPTRSRSTSPPRCCSTASAACSASAAPGSPSRSPATRSSTLIERGAAAAGRHRRASEPFESYFSGNTDPDLPGRRADRRPVPVPGPPVRPGLHAERVRALRGRLRAAHRPPARQGHCAGWPATTRRSTRSGTATRAGSGFRYARQADRLTTPLVRDEETGELRAGVAGPRRSPSPPRGCAGRDGGGVGVLTGGRLTVEDAYAYAKFARVALGTNDIDFRARPHSARGGRLPGRHAWPAAPTSPTPTSRTRRPWCWSASSPRRSRPIVFLRLRKAHPQERLKVVRGRAVRHPRPGEAGRHAGPHRAGRRGRGRSSALAHDGEVALDAGGVILSSASGWPSVPGGAVRGRRAGPDDRRQARLGAAPGG